MYHHRARGGACDFEPHRNRTIGAGEGFVLSRMADSPRRRETEKLGSKNMSSIEEESKIQVRETKSLEEELYQMQTRSSSSLLRSL